MSNYQDGRIKRCEFVGLALFYAKFEITKLTNPATENLVLPNNIIFHNWCLNGLNKAMASNN